LREVDEHERARVGIVGPVDPLEDVAIPLASLGGAVRAVEQQRVVVVEREQRPDAGCTLCQRPRPFDPREALVEQPHMRLEERERRRRADLELRVAAPAGSGEPVADARDAPWEVPDEHPLAQPGRDLDLGAARVIVAGLLAGPVEQCELRLPVVAGADVRQERHRSGAVRAGRQAPDVPLQDPAAARRVARADRELGGGHRALMDAVLEVRGCQADGVELEIRRGLGRTTVVGTSRCVIERRGDRLALEGRDDRQVPHPLVGVGCDHGEPFVDRLAALGGRSARRRPREERMGEREPPVGALLDDAGLDRRVEGCIGVADPVDPGRDEE
jgi:hypothetical protein